MDEKKLVTWEAFEQYHKNLMKYITGRDDLVLKDEETCRMTSEEDKNEDSE